MPRGVWTERELEYLADHLTRYCPETIARRIGRSKEAVLKQCQRRGWYPTRMDLVTSGHAAAMTGLTPQGLTKMAREGRIWARRVPGGRWWMFDPERLPEQRPALAPLIPRLREAFITPHAYSRFRERIWPGATDSQVEQVIRLALANPYSIKAKLRQDLTTAWTLRGKDIRFLDQEFEFRLSLVPSERRGNPPVVVTVLPGTRGFSRGRNWNSQLRARGVAAPAQRREWRG